MTERRRLPSSSHVLRPATTKRSRTHSAVNAIFAGRLVSRAQFNLLVAAIICRSGIFAHFQRGGQFFCPIGSASRRRV